MIKQFGGSSVFEFLIRGGLVSAAAAFLLVAATGKLRAQSDTFDTGNDSGLIRLNVIEPFGGTTTYSFPPTSTGLGYRLQCTSVAALGDYGAGRSFSYHTNLYTEFYAAVDLADWDNGQNQAAVLGARLAGYDETLDPCPLPACPPGFGMLRGYICNYDANQRGSSASSRLNGEFQINRVTNEGADNPSLAVAEVTLIPHQPYRMVLKGSGTNLTAQLYDYEDLTAPLVTIHTQDDDYTSGVSGLIAFSRDGTIADVTFDNFLALVSDPNADIAPAIRHPVAGTPQVVTRIPKLRFTNFHSTAKGISFTANTFTTNLINAGATRLYLNGVDVTSTLAPLPANGTNLTFQTAAQTLQPNLIYAGRIELADASGTLKSTNTFWFDTFSDAYISAEPVKAIEVEDYDYTDSNGDGRYLLDPIPISGVDTNGVAAIGPLGGYLSAQGTEGSDYHDNRTTPENGWNEYRSEDSVSTVQGGKEEIEDGLNYPPDVAPAGRPNDQQRQKYVAFAIPEYQVVHTEPGEWLDFTRAFAPTNYNVFLRVASFSPTKIQLDLLGNQTATALGSFDIPNDLMRINYRYVPLTSGGLPAMVHLAGTNALRLTIGGTPGKDNQVMALNYLLFVPTAASGITLMSAVTVTGPYTADSAAVVDSANKTITIPRAGDRRFYRLGGSTPVPNLTGIKLVGDNLVITYE